MVTQNFSTELPGKLIAACFFISGVIGASLCAEDALGTDYFDLPLLNLSEDTESVFGSLLLGISLLALVYKGAKDLKT